MNHAALTACARLVAQTSRQRISALALWVILATICILFVGIVVGLYLQRRRVHVTRLGQRRTKRRRFRADPWKEAANRIDVADGEPQEEGGRP